MIEIRNLTKERINKKFLRKVAQIVVRGEKEKLDISIAIMSPKEIQFLNRRYRKKNSSTDVLSFGYDDLGEIVLCPSVIKKYAKNSKLTFKNNLSSTLIHGVLHLLGYDHEKSKQEAIVMENKQNFYLNRISSLNG